MQRVWMSEQNAVTVEAIDFVDPAVRDQPDARERGVRVEVRPVRTSATGSVYSSPSWALEPGVVRVDLLESAPYAADRMHWHPRMHDGEPGQREYAPEMGADPGSWLTGFLADRPDVDDAVVDDVVSAVVFALEEQRKPWPDVEHDERGLVR